jgi:hypothetical protein
MKEPESKHTPSSIVKADANRDPLTGAHGAHPVGVGTGAAGGGMAGAVAGAVVAGPIGAAVGAVAGAVAGGLAGKEAAELVNPTVEHAYWRGEFGNRSYFTRGTPYEQYGPAFQYGWESCASHPGKTFEDVEPQMSRDWEGRRGESQLSWKHVRGAAYDAWQRVEKTVRGDCCGSA